MVYTFEVWNRQMLEFMLGLTLAQTNEDGGRQIKWEKNRYRDLDLSRSNVRKRANGIRRETLKGSDKEEEREGDIHDKIDW